MHKTRVLITMGCCLFAMTLFAGAQAIRKPGLWEMTTNMTWQQSSMPPGMTNTKLVCLTQEMINKYGAPMPQSPNCQISNVVLKATSMTADWVCSGRMAGKGTLESSWADPNHAIGKVHFVATMQMGQNSRTVEYTINSSSVFKSPDCGSVAPLPMPKN
jgi:Protein of unknown function (DUF3617)